MEGCTQVFRFSWVRMLSTMQVRQFHYIYISWDPKASVFVKAIIWNSLRAEHGVENNWRLCLYSTGHKVCPSGSDAAMLNRVRYKATTTKIYIFSQDFSHLSRDVLQVPVDDIVIRPFTGLKGPDIPQPKWWLPDITDLDGVGLFLP